MPFPKIWDLIEKFKSQCGGKGWRLHGNEDIVDTGREYHYFVWSRHIYPSTFKRVVTNAYFPMREGSSYRIVNVSYIAWISLESISQKVLDIFLEIPNISRRVAVYDVSPIYKDRLICQKMNETDSSVFKEFERFLTEKYRIKFEPFEKSQSAMSDLQPIV